MELLDLPLDVFRTILEATVIVLGAQRVPRLRLVNKFFDGEVIRAACITGILDYCPHVWGPWVAWHLQRRVLAHRARDNNYLVCTLGRVVDEFVAKYEGDEQHERKLEISLTVSRAAAQYLKLYAFDQSSRLGIGQTSHAPEHLLSAAAYVGDVSVVESLLARGVDVNAGNNVFGKPLFAAASAGNLDVVRLLLARGADADDGVYPRTEDDERLMETAYNSWGLEMHIACCEEGVRTALDAAAIGGYEEVVRLLLQPEFGVSRLTYSYRHAIVNDAHGGNANVMRLLNEAGNFSGIPKQWLRQLWGCALQVAAEMGQPDTLLLQRGAAVDGTSNCRDTPIIMAAGGGYLQVVELLLDHGAELHQDWKQHPLERAAEYGQAHVVRFFLDRGAHLRMRYGGEYALDFALERGYESVAAMLMDYGVALDKPTA
ncbi:hypothetical protein VTN00DRAFT_8490 [Thermoascus crustaceus]|uniref:uncharacterized protein n=1 Tax=Thermoascus crustaceus TaxID=5088 RepID=UPI003744AE9B